MKKVTFMMLVDAFARRKVCIKKAAKRAALYLVWVYGFGFMSFAILPNNQSSLLRCRCYLAHQFQHPIVLQAQQ